mgnify:CR=1 FL=1
MDVTSKMLDELVGACLVGRIDFVWSAGVAELGLVEGKQGKNHHPHRVWLPALGDWFWHDVWCLALSPFMQLHGVWLHIGCKVC